MSINHIALNLVTKGLLNISNVNKGMVTIGGYEIVYKRKGGGSSLFIPYGKEERLYKDIDKNYNEIDYIKVYINWNKKNRGSKKIEAKLLKDYIEASIFIETEKNINVKLI